MQVQVARAILAVLTAVLLAGCAGGGGGGGAGGGDIAVSPPPLPPPAPPPPPPPPPPPGGIPSTTSAEYTRSYAVADTKAITAWQNGATGQGVLVAVIDDGVDASHPELAGRVSPASIDINGARNQLFSINDTHGSELSAIIAGNFNNDSTIGLAYNATILAVRADNGAGTFNSGDLANSVDYAINRGAKIINFSLGSANPSSPVFQAAIQRATQAGIIVVVSAGNDGPNAAEVNFPGFLATNSAVSNNLIMIAGSHDRNGSLVSFSNRAGQAQNFYVTAPGLQIIVPDFALPGPTDPAFQVCPPPGGDAGTCRVQGTSYSAPYLTGAVALVLGAFPGLTPQQVVQLILNAADDYGAPGVDAVVGHGRLNIDRAFQPVGMVAAPLAPGVSVGSGDTLGIRGQPFGDGLTVDPGLWRTVGFDSYGRTFAVDLARNWREGVRAGLAVSAPMVWRTVPTASGYASFASEDRTLPQTLRTPFDAADVSTTAFRMETALSSGARMVFAAHTPALRARAGIGALGHLEFAGAAASVAMIQDLGSSSHLAFTAQSGASELGRDLGESRRVSFALQLDHKTGPFDAAVTFGATRERGSLLGLAWTEKFGARPGADAMFVGVEGSWRVLRELTVSASGEIGSVPRSRAWLSVDAPLTTSAFALGLTQDVKPDWLEAVAPDAVGRFNLALRQPLRIEDGTLAVSLPTATAWGRSSLAYESRRFSPVPSGRELELQASFDLFIADRVSARFAYAHASEPGHVAGAAPEDRTQIGVRVNF